MTEKRFQYNVNKNTIEENGKFVAYVNSVDGVRIAKKLNILQNENEQLKSELAEIKRQDQEVIEYLQAYHKGDVNELKKELKSE